MTTKSKPTIRPMTRRGPDGRPHETEEMEQRATEAQKADADTPRRPPVTVVGNPD
ncbi:MAG: hypothetical protein ACO1O4_18595 [Devosia sp.]